MIVLHQIHGELAQVAKLLLADAVLGKGLLHQDVAAVFFIFQNVADRRLRPDRPTLGGGDALALQFLFDHTDAVSSEETVIDMLYHRRLLRDDAGLAVLIQLIGVQVLELDVCLALPHGLPLAPDDVGGHGLALRLGKGAHHGDEHLTVHLQGIDVLLLEDHGDTQGAQGADVVEAVHRVPGEAGDGLDQHQVDLLLTASADHPLELRPLLGRSAGDALIREDPRHGPLGIGHDLVGVVGLLGLVAGELLLIIRGHPAVSRDTQMALNGPGAGQLRLRRYDDDFGDSSCHV